MISPVPIQRLPHAEGLPLPAYESAHAAGMDLRAAVPDGEPLTLRPGDRDAVPTGLAMAIPPGFEGQVRPRSGLALRHGVTCLNSPGTIDQGYRGEIGVILINHGREAFQVAAGAKIAQMVVQAVTTVEIEEIETLSSSQRGAGGFGSTGR